MLKLVVPALLISGSALSQGLPEKVEVLGGLLATFGQDLQITANVGPSGVQLKDGRTVKPVDGKWIVEPTRALAPQRFEDCIGETHSGTRLMCFDLAGQVHSAARREAMMAESIKPQVVSAADLGIGTSKYDRKMVEVRGAYCVHADTDDYRCVLGGNVSVFTKSVEPPASKAHIEEKCGSVEKAFRTPACRFTIRFVVGERNQDLISGYQQRTVFSPERIWTAEERRRR